MTKKQFAAEEVEDLERKLEKYQNAIYHIQVKLDFWRTVLNDEEPADGPYHRRLPDDERFWDDMERLKPKRFKVDVPL